MNILDHLFRFVPVLAAWRSVGLWEVRQIPGGVSGLPQDGYIVRVQTRFTFNYTILSFSVDRPAGFGVARK